jgi:hypothetical protein
MGAHHARRQEQAPEQAPETAPAPPLPAAPLAPQALDQARVIALQRLVGNAAVVEMMRARERPAEQGRSEVPEAANSEDGVIEAVLDVAAEPDGSAAAESAGVAGAVAPATTAALAEGAAPAEGGGIAGAVAPATTAALADAAAPAEGAYAAKGGGRPANAGPPTLAVARAPAAAPPTGRARPAAPGEAGEIRDPHDDPKFKSMKSATKSAGTKSKTHQPAAEAAATAQGAAVPPANDAPSQAAAAQVDEMGKQQPGVFDKKAFVAAVKQAIDKATPQEPRGGRGLQGVGQSRSGQGRGPGAGQGWQEGVREGHQAGHRRAARPVQGYAQARHPDGQRRAGRAAGRCGCRGRDAQAASA